MSHSKKNKPVNAITDSSEAVLLLVEAAPVNVAELEGGVDATVVVVVDEALLKDVLKEVVFKKAPVPLPASRVKFAQVIRVLLAKCTVIERFPKNAPLPWKVDAKSSSYDAIYGSEVIAPYFPERSPTWQVCGRESTQAGV